MKNLILAASFAVMVSGCASVSVTQSQQDARKELASKYYYKHDSFDDFRKAVTKPNPAAVKLFFESANGIPFQVNGENDRDKGSWILKESDGNAAIVAMTLKQKDVGEGAFDAAWSHWKPECPVKNDPVSEVLFSHRTTASTYIYRLIDLANQGCVNEFAQFLSLYPEAAHPFIESSHVELLTDTIYNRSSTIDDEKFAVFSKLLVPLKTATQVQCSKKDLEACRDTETLDKVQVAAREKHEAYKTTMATREADQKASVSQQEEGRHYVESGDQDIDLACAAIIAVKSDELAIVHEKKIGQTSGAVNLLALNQLGRRLEGTKLALQDFKNDIIKKTGKAFDQSTCKGRKAPH